MNKQEMEEGSEIKVKEVSVKKNLKSTQDILFFSQASIVSFILNKHPELAQEFLLEYNPELWLTFQIGTAAKVGAKVISTLSKDFLLKKGLQIMLQKFQGFLPIKDMIIHEIKNGAIIKIPKCNGKKNFYKSLKKCKKTIPKDAFCKYWCSPLFKNQATPFGFEMIQKYTKNGCIITIQIM